MSKFFMENPSIKLNKKFHSNPEKPLEAIQRRFNIIKQTKLDQISCFAQLSAIVNVGACLMVPEQRLSDAAFPHLNSRSIHQKFFWIGKLNAFIHRHVDYTWEKVYTFYVTNDVSINFENIVNIIVVLKFFTWIYSDPQFHPLPCSISRILPATTRECAAKEIYEVGFNSSLPPWKIYWNFSNMMERSSTNHFSHHKNSPDSNSHWNER